MVVVAEWFFECTSKGSVLDTWYLNNILSQQNPDLDLPDFLKNAGTIRRLFLPFCARSMKSMKSVSSFIEEWPSCFLRGKHCFVGYCSL